MTEDRRSLTKRLAIAARIGDSSSSVEGRLERMTRFFGGDAEIVPTPPDSATALNFLQGWLAVALSADTLIALGQHETPDVAFSSLGRANRHLLVWGWRSDPAHKELLRRLSHGAIATIEPATSSASTIPMDSHAWMGCLANSKYPAAAHASAFGFAVAPTNSSCHSLVNRGGLSTFATLRTDSHKVFITTASDVVDVDATASTEFAQANSYDYLLPYLIFIRTAFGRACWRSSLQTSRLIVDDPLLKRRYGLLKYGSLFQSMGTVGYGTTIAFIPWNYRRTSSRQAASFRAHTTEDRFSICVHGCDHTRAEFGSRDAGVLGRRAALAVRRMEKHQTRTQLPFESVMVFPQGIFSKAAPMALRANGFRAAINTTRLPLDYDGELKVGDLLSPAVTAFGGFPIFARHYARSSFDLAFDLYLGRPAFIVEHHEFFGDGLPSLETLVSDLRCRSSALQSLSVTDAVTRTHWERVSNNGSNREVRFYTDRFMVVNTDAERLSYTLSKPEPDPDLIDAVTVNGAAVPFIKDEGRVTIEAELAAGRSMEIALRARLQPSNPVMPALPHTLRVLVRRGLSEFRDEILCHHPGAVRAAKRTMSKVRSIGGSRLHDD